MALGDRWFYESLDDPAFALGVLVSLFEGVLDRDLETDQRRRVVLTLLEFLGALCADNTIPESIGHSGIELLQRSFQRDPLALVQISGHCKKHLQCMARFPSLDEPSFALTRAVLSKTLDFWAETSDAESWFEERQSLFLRPQIHLAMTGKPYFAELRTRFEQANSWSGLAATMSFNDLANHFRRCTDRFETTLERIYFLFYLLRLPGMQQMRDNLLWDLNRLLRSVRSELTLEQIEAFLERIYSLFVELKNNHPANVLDCILTLGKEIVQTENQRLINLLQTHLIRLGFIRPGTVTVTEDWQIHYDANHVKNIRTWLELVECDPARMKLLLAALIANLRLGGIFISDTDLFQKDVTRLLNCAVAPHYKLVKQLARIFPVYFNEIGAEGELRTVTTSLDEISQRQDRLIHFLRKQVHTESNNTQVDLAVAILRFWHDGNREPVDTWLPSNVRTAIDPEGEWFASVHRVLVALCEHARCEPDDLYQRSLDEVEADLAEINVGEERDRKRVLHLVRLCALLREKYRFDAGDILTMLARYRFFDRPDLDRLAAALENDDARTALEIIFSFIEKLNGIVLDSAPSDGWENIYYKRHVAAGIPSMYGRYREPKFEALGLVFRLEQIASRLMEQVIQTINLEYASAQTLRRIYDVISLLHRGLLLDGIHNEGFDSNLKLFRYSLTSASFSLDQYLNIFQFMAGRVKEIIHEYFFRIYEGALADIIPQIERERDGGPGVPSKQYYHQTSEKFYRDILTSAFFVQTLDNFISRVLQTLQSMVDHYPRDLIQKLMSYDPDLIVSPLYAETPRTDNRAFLGAKAYFLKKMHAFGFPIPPGFVLTTELFRHEPVYQRHVPVRQEIEGFVRTHLTRLESLTGLRYGDPEKPLLLSVRGGAAISLPGAMNTFLNVGLNDELVEAMSRQEGFGWTSWDCYRRFLQSWGMSHGIPRDAFDAVIVDYKARHDVEQKIQFKPAQMREIAFAYLKTLHAHDVHFEDEPFAQLLQAVSSVIASWSSERARVYRENFQIASEWGTAVIVQKMVFGNISHTSGSGVLFTNDLHRGKPGINLNGDFTLCSQGEDIVAGLVHALPISEFDRKRLRYDHPMSLESSHPAIYGRLHDLATKLIEEHGFSHQEIEFTFESDQPEDLYILQTRTQNIQEDVEPEVFAAPADGMRLLGRGIGIGGGALNGILAFDMSDLERLEAEQPDRKHILVRPDTVPDDIGMIFRCDGLLTGKGGATSHAAVTAVRLGKVCIVGCRELQVDEKAKTCTINRVVLRPGDRIAIDGQLGNIYKGNFPTTRRERNRRKL